MRSNKFNTVQNKQSGEFAYDVSDVDTDSSSYEKFLKNSYAGAKKQNQPTISQNEAPLRPKTSRGAPAATLGQDFGPKRPYTSSALDRFSMLEAKIKQRQKTLKGVNLSTSDYDMDISSDSDVKESVGKGHIKLRNKINTRSLGTDLNIAEFSSSSSEESENKLRFVKRTTPDNEQMFLKSSIESLSESIKGSIMKSHEKENRLKKTVSFVSPDESSVSLDNFLPQKSFTESSDISSLDDFAVSTKLHNVMTLDDLFVADEKLPAKQGGSSVNYSSDFEMSTEQGLSNYSQQSQDDENNDNSNSSSQHGSNFLNIHSIEELAEFKTPGIVTAVKNIPIKENDEVHSIASAGENVNYSDDFHDDTLKDTESISEDSIKEIDDINTNSTRSSISEILSNISSTKSTLTDTSMSSTPTMANHSSEYTENTTTDKKKEIKVSESPKQHVTMATQTSELLDQNLGSYVFTPTPLIKNEALDILTTYNPTMLAIQDLLKQQVHLTKEFVAQSRRLHNLTNSSIPCDYVYGSIDITSIERRRKLLQD